MINIRVYWLDKTLVKSYQAQLQHSGHGRTN